MSDDRTTRLLRYVDVDRACGLEIGPLDKPLVARKAGRRIHYCDYADRDTLRQRSSADPNVNIERIPEIDFVTSQLKAEIFGDLRFDYIIASHVVEHVPDAFGWLGELLRVLNPGGRIVLAVPDRRYTFDYLRPESTTGQMAEASVERRSRPTFAQVYDAFGTAMKVDTAQCWKHGAPARPLVPYYDKDLALRLARHAHDDGGYHDCHCWVFTYESFLAVMDEARTMGFLPAKVTASTAPVYGSNEFHVVLESTGGGA